ncbi:MAG: FG-GAP repeat protein, partial [Spirochaetales bacterium]|nr:FG-GAP repeat protein [Spirochaetales bacterium]MCF7939745.1 FG-GAP repeat protein [Spirochaetales bacterium]
MKIEDRAAKEQGNGRNPFWKVGVFLCIGIFLVPVVFSLVSCDGVAGVLNDLVDELLYPQVKKLTASDGGAHDNYGYSVAVSECSSSGDCALVGAYKADSDAGTGTGAAYIYEEDIGSDTWSETKLSPSDGDAGDQFGYSVDISGDYAVIGARYNDVAADDQPEGATYVFKRNGLDNWGQVAKLTASDGADSDCFGECVAISGPVVVVGAPYHNSTGAAYVFDGSGGWSASMTEDAKLTASDGSGGDDFGISVAVYGSLVAVGAVNHNSSTGAAYVFEEPAGGWSSMTEDAKLTATGGEANDNLGCSAAVYQNTVLVGAYGDDGSGSAYIFEEPQSGWSSTVNETAKLTPSDGLNGDYFANH